MLSTEVSLRCCSTTGPEFAPMQVLFVPVTPLQAKFPIAVLLLPFASA